MIQNLKQFLVSSGVAVENEFLTRYINLLENRRYQEHEIFKTQCHHIIPKFVYKLRNEDVDDSLDNKVWLYYSEHVLAHYYLAMCASSQRLRDGNLCAVRQVIYGVNEKTDEQLLINSLPEIQEIYQQCKHITCLRDDTPEKISVAIRGRKYIYNAESDVYRCCKGEELEQLLSTGLWVLKHPSLSKDTCNVISSKLTGRRTMNKDDVTCTVAPEQIDEYLANGWVFGNPKLAGRRGHARGKTTVIKDGVCKYIELDELDKYLQLGWTKGNVNTGKHITISNPWKGRADHCKELSAARVGKVCINNGLQNKYVLESDLEKYLQKGWMKGSKLVERVYKSHVWVRNNDEEQFILNDKVSTYIENGWELGRKKKK